MPDRHGSFICPECGSTQAQNVSMREMPAITSAEDLTVNPWLGVLQTILCAQCGREIPSHLGKRWDGITLEEAQQAWQEIYRDTADDILE